MANILIFAELANNKIKKGVFELLTAARGTGHDVKVFAFGAGGSGQRVSRMRKKRLRAGT